MPDNSFLKHFASSNLLYWRQGPVEFSELAILFASNSVLLVLAKSARIGFGGINDVLIGVIMALIIMFLQYAASVVAALRPGVSNLVSDAPKLAKSIAITWLISLILFMPNAIPPLSWFDSLPAYWLVAVVHAGGATLVLGCYSYFIVKDADNGHVVESKTRIQLVVCGLFNFVVCSVLFNLFVLSELTHNWLLNNLDALVGYLQ